MRKYLRVVASGVAMAAAVSGWTNAVAQKTALTGIETADLDRKLQPCDNFYDYSNGTWREQNPIPASMDRWSRRWQAGEANKDQLKVILDDLSAKQWQVGTPAQLTGDFYAACTNSKAINERGLKPIWSARSFVPWSVSVAQLLL